MYEYISIFASTGKYTGIHIHTHCGIKLRNSCKNSPRQISLMKFIYKATWRGEFLTSATSNKNCVIKPISTKWYPSEIFLFGLQYAAKVCYYIDTCLLILMYVCLFVCFHICSSAFQSFLFMLLPRWRIKMNV